MSLKFLRGLCKGAPTTAPSKAKAEATDGDTGPGLPGHVSKVAQGLRALWYPVPGSSPQKETWPGAHIQTP